MFLTFISKPKRLLYLSFVERVTVQELKRERADVAKLLEDLSGDFRVLADLSHLESIDPGCAQEIGAVMELCDARGVRLVVRIIPDPRKDIGLNILSLFHYRRRPRIVTCQNLSEAARVLGISGSEPEMQTGQTL